MSGRLRVDPSPFTLADLFTMDEEAGKDEWERFSALMALIANINRKPGSDTVSPDEFNPYRRKEKIIPKAPLTVLKDIFCKET